MFFELVVGFIIGYIVGKMWFCGGLGGLGGLAHGPNSKDIIGQVFEHNGKYYKFTPSICPCPLLRD